MKTTAAIVSSICYGTKDFVSVKLADLVKRDFLSFYAVMEHPETVDTTTGEFRKRHLHVVIEPKTRIPLDTISDLLSMPDPQDPRAPLLGCMPWRKTRDDLVDWLAYAIHDKQYLAFKKEPKKAYYDLPLSDIATNKPEFLQAVFCAFPREKWQSDIEKVTKAILAGTTFAEFVLEQRTPANQLANVSRCWEFCIENIAQFAQALGYKMTGEILRIAERTKHYE